MDINPQTREISVEEWWAFIHGSDQPISGIDNEELLRQAESLGMIPSQIAEMNMLGVDCRASPEATGQVSQASETAGLHLMNHAFSPSLERQIYGSNEDVYNPYNPLASKEYLAQEVAAGRVESAAMPQKYPRASRTTRGYSLGSVFRSASRDSPFGYSLTDEILDRSGRGQTPPRKASDSEGAIEGRAGNYSSDVLRYLFEQDFRSSAISGRRQGPLIPYDSDAGADSGGEDQSGLDSEDLARPLASGEINSSSGDIRTPRMDSFRSRQVRPADSAARAKDLLWATSSRNYTAPTKIASISTHQPATEALGWTGLADHDRKRRRNDRSPQEAVPPPPVPGVIGAPRTAARRAITTTSGSPGRSRLRAEAPVFIPRLAQTILSPPLRGQPSDLGQVLPENIRLTTHQRFSQHPTPTATTQTSTAKFLPSQSSTRHLVFTSELIPASLGRRKRIALLNILRIKAPYVPACIAMPPMLPKIQYHISLKPKRSVQLPSSDQIDAPLGSHRQGWPVAPDGCLPLEVFQNIARYLPRTALESMRLVNREFERNVSNVQFRKVVVPFRPEIYDILDPRGPLRKVADVKGKGKEKSITRETLQRKLRTLIRICRSAT